MSKGRFWSAGALLVLFACQGTAPRNDGTLIALAEGVPFGASREEVGEILSESGITGVGFDEGQRTLYAKVQVDRSRTLVAPVTLFEFVFSPDDRLLELKIKRRFVGP